MFRISIIGRPNVGKSSLFNRLIGKNKSIVADQPGITRDRIEAEAKLLDLKFHLTDTGGIFGNELKNIADNIKMQVDNSMKKSDLIFLVVDAKAGLTDADREVANFIFAKNFAKPIIIVANKAESGTGRTLIHEFYSLPIKELVAISAAHNLGMEELYDSISKYYFSEKEVKEKKSDHLMISIVGRPNSGKSTLVNNLVGEERVITGEMAGLTRDSIDIDFMYKNNKIKLVDTAGIRKRKYIDDYIEKLSVEDSFNSVKYSQIVILLLDAKIGFDHHEMSLANKIIEEGRILVLAINKWDIVKDKNLYFQQIKSKIEETLPQIAGIPILYISAKQKKNLSKLLDACLDSYVIWNSRISTGKLNNWLKKVTEAHPIGLNNNKKTIRIKYITQYKSRPPSFKLFCNMPDALSENYLRYLTNNMRKDLNLGGVPIRLELAKVNNPYDKKIS